MSDEARGVDIPARTIPIPKSISAEAQAFFAHVPIGGDTAMPPASDKQAWRKQIAQADAHIAGMVRGQAEAWPARTQSHALPHAALYEIAPDNADAANARRAILYIHGGGFCMGGGELAALAAVPFAGRARCRTFSVDYRMPPDHPFPAGLEDCVDAWRWLTERYDPARLVVYGPSAGGNLVPALVLRLRELGLPLPAACAAHSPAADLTESGDSYQTNSYVDVVLRHPMPSMMDLYAGGHDKRDPLLSPAFADYAGGFPPTLLTTGTRDLLLSSTVLLHRAMRRGGVKADLHVWEAMTHSPFFGAPEEAEFYAETLGFLFEHMGCE